MGDAAELLEQRAAEYGERLDDMSPEDRLIEDLLGDMRVSMSEASQFCDPEWIYENLIIKGHVIVIPAEPNGGKTTILWSICPVMVQAGYSVTYINADISGGDAKSMVAEAEAKGINLLLPDMGLAHGMEHVVKQLHTMAKSGNRFDDKVFIFDTLKKMIPPNDKGATRWLFKVLRQLSAQGMTIVLLAHTLKRYTDTGLPEYEGVADIRADVDELIYLIPSEQPDGCKLVSTMPDKVRGEFKPISFRINQDRTVTPLQKHHNLQAAKAYERQFEKDRENIELVHDALEGRWLNQSEIIGATGLGKNSCIRLLKRYRGKQWQVEVGDKNSKRYRSIAPGLRYPRENRETGGEE